MTVDLDIARECFLNMIAEAKRFDEDVDGDVIDGHEVVYVRFHITTGDSEFRELAQALGIKIGFQQSTMEAVQAALKEEPAAPQANANPNPPGWSAALRDPLIYPPHTPTCGQVAESDEYVCRSCGLRWDRNEDRPACPKS